MDFPRKFNIFKDQALGQIVLGAVMVILTVLITFADSRIDDYFVLVSNKQNDIDQTFLRRIRVSQQLSVYQTMAALNSPAVEFNINPLALQLIPNYKKIQDECGAKKYNEVSIKCKNILINMHQQEDNRLYFEYEKKVTDLTSILQRKPLWFWSRNLFLVLQMSFAILSLVAGFYFTKR